MLKPTLRARGLIVPALSGIGLALLVVNETPVIISRSTPDTITTAPSSAWLSLLPDGAEKRQFIIDCTGCHQMDAVRALSGGRARTEAEWAEAVRRMLGFAGPSSGFPVISAAQTPEKTAAWLARHLPPDGKPPENARPPVSDRITEYLFPAGQDLPHDVAVDANGRVIVTGMFSHKMYSLEPTLGVWTEIEMFAQANPRAVDIDHQGRWWVVLGGPGQIGRYDAGAWTYYDIGLYAHSVVLANGSAFANGHFTRNPEQIIEVTDAGQIRTHNLPNHPELAANGGGPIPYEIRAAPDGRIWMSELQGNRLVVLDPRNGATEAFPMPTPNSGPRRFDIDRQGILWIPMYGAGTLVRFDPRNGQLEEIPLPIKDAAPYVVRVDSTTGVAWIGTGAADAVFAYDTSKRTFTTYGLPTNGALVRHLWVDSKRGDVWLAYGESPGKSPSRIARLHYK
jgi:virginiamycin B lyase